MKPAYVMPVYYPQEKIVVYKVLNGDTGQSIYTSPNRDECEFFAQQYNHFMGLLQQPSKPVDVYADGDWI